MLKFLKFLSIAQVAIFWVLVTTTSASTGWESRFDILWNITVTNECSGESVTYVNCHLVNNHQEFFWLSFIPDQNKVSAPHGKQIRINTLNGCITVAMQEAD